MGLPVHHCEPLKARARAKSHEEFVLESSGGPQWHPIDSFEVWQHQRDLTERPGFAGLQELRTAGKLNISRFSAHVRAN